MNRAYEYDTYTSNMSIGTIKDFKTQTNMYDNCKNLSELMNKHKLDVRACETFEYLGKIEKDFDKKYKELMVTHNIGS